MLAMTLCVLAMTPSMLVTCHAGDDTVRAVDIFWR